MVYPVTTTANIRSVTPNGTYFFQLYDPVSNKLIGNVQARNAGAKTGTIKGIVSADTYNNLKAEVTTLGLLGTLSPE